MLALVLGAAFLAGCTPVQSTIGGYSPEQLAQVSRAARDACQLRRGQVPPHAFTTDGCSLWPDGRWQSCCVDHDTIYWCGGTAAERRKADEALRACVAGHGWPITAALMDWGVWLGGTPWVPARWRWGYGWPWPHGYEKSR